MSMTYDHHIINGRLLDVDKQCFTDGELWIHDGRIVSCQPQPTWQAKHTYDASGQTIVPGFIDAHMHIESSLLTPTAFGDLVLPKGVTRIFADPHEIASVAGTAGLNFMLAEAEKTPLHIHYMLPSSVPALASERTGATLTAADLRPFYASPLVAGLAEVMDYPAVANDDPDMHQKIADAKAAGRHIDGHAAGFTATQLECYQAHGITTDHEATTAAEARARLAAGMAVFIREGTVERDEKALLPAVTDANNTRFAFATDDKTANDLQDEGSIDANIRLAIAEGITPARAYAMASYHAAQAHELADVGALAPGYCADLVVLADVTNVTAADVMVAGNWYTAPAAASHTPVPFPTPFNVTAPTLTLPLDVKKPAHVIGIMPHHITTEHLVTTLPAVDGQFLATVTDAKMVVAERYHDLGYGIGVIRGLGLKAGAIASTVAHDSHNVVVAGHDDAAMQIAIAALREASGGLVVVDAHHQPTILPLAIGGLMSTADYTTVCAQTLALQAAFQTISDIPFDPFLTLSFMALPVIPSLKLTDQGLYDVALHQYIAFQEGNQ